MNDMRAKPLAAVEELNLPAFVREHGSGSSLICPRCGEGGQGLHHGDVAVGTRQREGGDGRVTCIDANGDVMVREASSGALSLFGGDRDGLRIRFLCESCDEDGLSDLVLTIWNYKGKTFMRWEEAADGLKRPGSRGDSGGGRHDEGTESAR